MMRNKILGKYFQEITNDDIDLIKGYLSLRQYEESSQNILNIMEWIELAPLYEMHNDECMWIVAEYQDHYYLYLPICKAEAVMDNLAKAQVIFTEANEELYLISVTKEYMEAIMANFGSAKIEEDRNNFDYVYHLDAMRTFSGKKLQKKRNHLNQFYVLYGERYQYEPITDANRTELRDYVLNSETDEEMLDFEKQGIIRVLDNYEKIGCQGCIIRIDGNIEGYLIASPLSKRMIQQNVEKANHKFRGLSQVLIKEFFSRNYLDYELLNREEDMGLPNLHKSKLSYYPAYLIEKYSVKL